MTENLPNLPPSENNLPEPSGSPFLDQVRRQIIETWTPSFYKQKVDELINASDVKSGKNGTYETPNWRARKEGIDKMEKILIGDDKKSINPGPIKITINVNGKPQAETIEAQVVTNQPEVPQTEPPINSETK